MPGLYLAVFFALPAGVVVVYFSLKGSWDKAFIGAAIFIGCGLILTSVRPLFSIYHVSVACDYTLEDGYLQGSVCVVIA
jgi:hypothetical protein